MGPCFRRDDHNCHCRARPRNPSSSQYSLKIDGCAGQAAHDARGNSRAPQARPRYRTSPRSWPRSSSCQPRPRTEMPDSSARKRGWRRPACSRIARPRRVMPSGSTSACRCMIIPVWVQRSKWPIHNCSLMAAISRCTPRHGAEPGIFMSKAQARCSASISVIQVKDSW